MVLLESMYTVVKPKYKSTVTSDMWNTLFHGGLQAPVQGVQPVVTEAIKNWGPDKESGRGLARKLALLYLNDREKNVFTRKNAVKMMYGWHAHHFVDWLVD
ncbi:unnamed protein product [Porites evermanni]|uniref:Uncharacterized protein n=1 Tax=Porites evermanni TaxID=104178 RepID=A0ABN8RQL7_9CNID|nr:unnamed protein product [Porites evermanni]